MTYSEKLLDPRWQKKRLLIFQRDNFECTECGDGKKTIHVHHKEYIKWKEPWDYEDDLLTTLCADCHQSKHYNPQTVSDLNIWHTPYYQELAGHLTKRIDDLRESIRTEKDSEKIMEVLVEFDKLTHERLDLLKNV
jgi:hypothetical protein